jgi:indolepyruvate ferredoxin oxidoreductase
MMPQANHQPLPISPEQTFIAAGVPFFYPRSIHDIIPMGLQAFALSRLAGCCVGMKIVVDTADASSIIDLDRIRPEITANDESGPVHIGRHDPALVREDRLFNLRLPAVRQVSKSAKYKQHNRQPASHWQTWHHDGWQNNL